MTTVVSRRNFSWGGREFEFPEQPVASVSDIDDFLDDGESGGGGSFGSDESREIFDEDDERENFCNAEESKKFWECQHQLLQATLCRTTSIESKIRKATKEALKESDMVESSLCVCGKQTANGCRNCLMREVSGRLQRAGYNVAICKSKWRSSSYIPSGEHTFLDVIESSPKKGEVRVIIELNFRAEFEIARACEEYNQLVKQLPNTFVGKIDRLQAGVQILCSAAKKCMKEKKMHMGPWRKHKYMQAKWLNCCERTTATPILSMAWLSGTERKPRASMLTLDLREGLPNLRRTAVEVV